MAQEAEGEHGWRLPRVLLPALGARGETHGLVGRLEQRAGFAHALGLFTLRNGIGDDAGTGLHIHDTILHHRSPEHDAAVHLAVRGEVPDAAGIDAARLFLKLVDDLHGAHLRGARNSARRKARHQRIDRVEFRIEFPFDIGNDVHHLTVIFQEEAVGDAHAADLRHAPDIVAAEIEQHQMLGALLGVGEQLLGERFVFVRRGTARPRAGDGPDGDLALAYAHQNLGARTHHGEVTEVQEIQKRRGVHPPQRAVERERGELERRLEALAEHHLKDIACRDVLLGARHFRHIGIWRGRGFRRGMRGIGAELAGMRQRLVQPLHDDVEPLRGARIGRLGAHAWCGPHRRHHGHLVFDGIEDHDQRRPHHDAVRQIERVELVAGQILDQTHRVIAHIAEDARGHQLPPLAAGIFGSMGYDTVRLIEDLPGDKFDPLDLPDSIMVRPTLIVIFDTVKDEMTVVTPVRPAPGVSAKSAYARAAERLNIVMERLDQPLPHASELGADAPHPAPKATTAPDAYMAKVARAKEYIAAGDIFQVVLSQRFEAPFELPSFALYRALRRVNPSPFLYFLNFGEFAMVGSSPEILVRVRKSEVTIRPIAGTRPRGATPDEDKALAEELLADTKERAEHLMLLDLGRNDVGRVAEVGSVRVTDSFFLEYYSQVMHIVSNVEGKLDSKFEAVDALMAGFPAGTVSGAPKVRAMEIIDELEEEARGIYAGCVGYFSADGEMDSCIVLRTSVVKDGVMYVQAGAGVVADSVPEREQAECVSKAGALFKAADEAVRFAARAKRGQ